MYISWFSCGAASATATKIALDEFGAENVRIIYHDTGSEHPDNKRFIKDCEEWYRKTIEITKSPDFSDIWEVFERRKYIVGIAGAPCTGELKRKVAEKIVFESEVQPREILGYTVEEAHRLERTRAMNSERKIDAILINKGITKKQCYHFLLDAGIDLPAMYKLGYNNNNCIGCVKGQSGYWNKIRIDFPDVFERMSKMERKVNAAINKRYEGKERVRVFLDELDPSAGRHDDLSLNCDTFCQTEMNFNDKGEG